MTVETLTLAAEYVALEVRAFDPNEHEGYGRYRAWLLEHGNVYPPTDVDPTRGPDRQCYRNAANTALHDRSLTYVEGTAMSNTLDHLGFGIDHAWCVDPDGNTIETTWDCGGSSYFGVPIPTANLEEIFINVQYRTPLLAFYTALVVEARR